LTGADLLFVSGNQNEIRSIMISNVYPISYTSSVIQIGCEQHRIEDWWTFDDRRILAMGGKQALKFWCKYRDLIRQVVICAPATS